MDAKVKQIIHNSSLDDRKKDVGHHYALPENMLPAYNRQNNTNQV